MSEWLDTETKAMLQQTPPEKLAPPDTGMFTLVLLQKGNDTARIVRALNRIRGLSPESAEHLIKRPCPLPVASSLSFADAMLGQFELVCCDSMSVFLRNEVASSADRSYLSQLYEQFRRSPEFENVSVTIASVPDTELGKRFLDQFLGEKEAADSVIPGSSCHTNMMRKKARIMAHWAQKMGVEVAIANEG